MAEEQVSPLELREKLKEYSKFIDSTLHPELKSTVSRHSCDCVYQELHDKLTVMNCEKEEGPYSRGFVVS
jgi:hypothetical protein